eukprot:scaffold7641_cov115-Cylindrotheca_fusiformis.AAC.26
MKRSKAASRNRQFPATTTTFRPRPRDRYERPESGSVHCDVDSFTSRTEASTPLCSTSRGESNMVSGGDRIGHGTESIRCQGGNSPISPYSSIINPSPREDRDDSDVYKSFNDDWLAKNMTVEKKIWKDTTERHLLPTLIQSHHQDGNTSTRRDFSDDWLKTTNHNECRKQPRLYQLIQKLRAEKRKVAEVPTDAGFQDAHYQERVQQVWSDQLKQTLLEQQAKFDKEKGDLRTEIETLKRSHEAQISRLQSDLQQATGSHKIYLEKLDEVVEYHEALHEQETMEMKSTLEEVRREKDKEISRLRKELYALRSRAGQSDATKINDPDLQLCLDYLKDENNARVHRFAQFEGTLRTLQSLAAKNRNRVCSNQDRQDMDDLLDMLYHVYRVAEDSNARTMDVTKLLVGEYDGLSRRTSDHENIKERLKSVQEELARAKQHRHQRQDACRRCQTLADDMEASLFRGLGLSR